MWTWLIWQFPFVNQVVETDARCETCTAAEQFQNSVDICTCCNRAEFLRYFDPNLASRPTRLFLAVHIDSGMNAVGKDSCARDNISPRLSHVAPLQSRFVSRNVPSMADVPIDLKTCDPFVGSPRYNTVACIWRSSDIMSCIRIKGTPSWHFRQKPKESATPFS